MGLFSKRKPKRAHEERASPDQIWDRDPSAARRDPITGMPADLLGPSAMPESLEPDVDPAKTRVFDDELE